jgi:cell division protein FtsI (penicillin-binding protein 3)
MAPNKNELTQAVKRIRIWYGLLILVLAIFVGRLFYLQVVRQDHYRVAALSDQLKQYEIPAVRGIISAYDGNATLPIVLNQQLYTLYADPVYIKKPAEAAVKVAGVVGGDVEKLEKQMRTKKTRYVVLGKKLSKEQSQRITKLKLAGVGTIAQSYRTYPQGSLAAQVLGFVNEEGKGKYGVEQALDGRLQGVPGQLKAITDAQGVPLAASRDNTRIAPRNGQHVVLTFDLAMQQQLENILAEGVKKAKAPSGTALIMDPNTGAIKAMANVPTYDPAKYFEVEKGELFQNGAVTHAIEIGSTMKTLTTAAALDSGAIKPDQTYYDPASWKVDDFKITNIEEDGGPGTRSVNDIINLSLNTGATWELMQMGGGEINQKGRSTWHKYMTEHYMFGKPTGLEQGYESEGYVPPPEDNGAGINLTYANTTFGQAMTATPIQLGAALSAAVNGGTYYQPRLLDKTTDSTGKVSKVAPKVVKRGVVRPEVSRQLVGMMQYVIDHRNLNPKFDQNTHMVGGKTGTAQIAKPDGGYFDNQFNGTYVGFVGGDGPQYVIVVFINKPGIGGYAGSAAAQPVFVDLARMLINNSYVTPKRQ